MNAVRAWTSTIERENNIGRREGATLHERETGRRDGAILSENRTSRRDGHEQKDGTKEGKNQVRMYLCIINFPPKSSILPIKEYLNMN